MGKSNAMVFGLAVVCVLLNGTISRLEALRGQASAFRNAQRRNGDEMTDQVLLLLVEDEPLLRLASGAALEDGGFGVAFACEGAEAILALDDQASRVAGLITDIRLGSGPDGWEVARRARERNPLLPVVYITGDSAADWPAYGVPNSLILQKPFADAQLLAAISSLLNDPNTNLAE